MRLGAGSCVFCCGRQHSNSAYIAAVLIQQTYICNGGDIWDLQKTGWGEGDSLMGGGPLSTMGRGCKRQNDS